MSDMNAPLQNEAQWFERLQIWRPRAEMWTWRKSQSVEAHYILMSHKMSRFTCFVVWTTT